MFELANNLDASGRVIDFEKWTFNLSTLASYQLVHRKKQLVNYSYQHHGTFKKWLPTLPPTIIQTTTVDFNCIGCRKIKRMLDSGEERFIHDILEQIADFLIGHEVLKESWLCYRSNLLNLLEPSAITALSEIGKLLIRTDDAYLLPCERRSTQCRVVN